MNISIIIPVFNERKTLPIILLKIIYALRNVEKEIIIIDDGSTDGTREWLLDNLGLGEKFINKSFIDDLKNQTGDIIDDGSFDDDVSINVVFQETNCGKGSSIRVGFVQAKNDVIVIQDADLEYDPGDLDKMWILIEENKADVVYGSRFYGSSHMALQLHHYMGNKLISNLVSIMCNIKLTDIETCYKMFRKEVLNGMKLISNDFGIEVELTMKIVLSRKWRIYETGIRYYGRTFADGKKINWRDGLKALWYIIFFRFVK